MNQLNQFMVQMKSLFDGMTPQSKLMALLLVVGISISSVFLIQGGMSGNGAMVPLLDGRPLSDEDLDRIEFALGKAGLRGFERIGQRIRVPKASSDEYYKAIAEGKAIPEGLGSALESALNSGSMMDSTSTTQSKQQMAKAAELRNAIKKMDPSIYDAYVTHDANRVGFSGSRKQVASVAILTTNGKELSMERRQAIVGFLEKSYAGLKQSDIAVYCNGKTTSISDDPTAIQQSKYYSLKRQQEEEYRERAQTLLSSYGNVRVDVNVQLDPIAFEETETLSFNEKPTTLQSATTKRDTKQQRMPQGGRPGVDPNVTANKGQSLSTLEQNNESKEQTESAKSVTGNTLKKTEVVGHQTKLVSVSIAIPFSYYQKAWEFKEKLRKPKDAQSKDPVAELTESELNNLKAETMRSIQGIINPILPPVAPGEDKFPRVSVESYLDLEVPGPPATALSETLLTWLSQSWQTLALFGLAGAALISLRSFAKTVPTANDRDFERGFDLPLDDASDIDLTSLTDEENSAFDTQSDEPNAPPRLRTTGGDIKNDLTAMVRENPDAAATMLRNWITEST